MDWIKKFFNDPSTVLVIFSSGLLGLVVGIANGVVQKRHGGWPAFFLAILTASTVAIIVGLALSEYVSEAVRLAIIGVCAIIAEDIWAGLKTLGISLRKNPLETFFRILDALRGRPLPPAPPDPKEE